MSMLKLPGLSGMVEVISKERNLPKHAVQNALREALLKGYEKFRKTYRTEEINFDEEYFENFDVELDIDNEGFRVLATKTILENVENTDHQISLAEVREVAPEAQAGGTVVVDVTPEQNDFGRMAAIQTKQVLAQKLRDQQRRLIQDEFQDLEGTVLQGRVLRFENSSVVMAVSSGFGQPEVEAELPKREQLPSERPYRPNSTLKVYLKKVYEGSRRGPQLMVSRADAGLVVYLLPMRYQKLRMKLCGSWQLPGKLILHPMHPMPWDRALKLPSTPWNAMSIQSAHVLALGVRASNQS